MKTIGDQQLVKRINRSVLLRLLRAQPGLSRAQLATESGLTKSTVSLLVRELIEEGWVTETDITTPPTQGRPSTPLHIDTRSRGLIGVEVAVEALRVVGVSLTGQVLCAAEEALNGTKPEDVCRQAARLIARTYKQLQQFLRSEPGFFFFLGCVFANFLTRTCTRSSLPGNFEQP